MHPSYDLSSLRVEARRITFFSAISSQLKSHWLIWQDNTVMRQRACLVFINSQKCMPWFFEFWSFTIKKNVLFSGTSLRKKVFPSLVLNTILSFWKAFSVGIVRRMMHNATLWQHIPLFSELFGQKLVNIECTLCELQPPSGLVVLESGWGLTKAPVA